MAAEEKAQSLEDALMRELRFGGLDKENLKELVGIVATIQQGGLRRLKVFPKGIPPLVDGLRIAGTIDHGEASRFMGELFKRIPRLSGIELFPIGIPWPEIWRVQIDLGATVQPPASGIQAKQF